MIVNNRIAGTRITVWDVLHHLENGWSLEEIADVFDVTIEQVRAAVDYIDANRAVVMKIHNEIEARNAKGNSPAVEESLKRARANRREVAAGRREDLQKYLAAVPDVAPAEKDLCD